MQQDLTTSDPPGQSIFRFMLHAWTENTQLQQISSKLSNKVELGQHQHRVYNVIQHFACAAFVAICGEEKLQPILKIDEDTKARAATHLPLDNSHLLSTNLNNSWYSDSVAARNTAREYFESHCSYVTTACPTSNFAMIYLFLHHSVESTQGTVTISRPCQNIIRI